MLMPCSAQVEVNITSGIIFYIFSVQLTQAQQLDCELPQDAVQEVGVEVDGQKTIIQVSKRYLENTRAQPKPETPGWYCYLIGTEQ